MNTNQEIDDVCLNGMEQETLRMSAVRRYEILDTPPDGTFDHVTAIAARLLKTPIAIVSIVDTDRIWFKSHHGLDLSQISRDPGLCASAIMQEGPWLVNNAKIDPRTMLNPLVAGTFGLVFYLGIPLQTHDGFNLGTLCVLDFEPRTVTSDQIDNLKDLARVVMDQLELRRSAIESIAALSVAVEHKEAAFRQSELMAKEIDHRVANSLQLVVSLLSVQSAQLRGTDAAIEISKAAGKILAIAQVHQHMRTDETVTTTDCAEYLVRLCNGLTSMLPAKDAATIDVSVCSVRLASEKIVRIGLIVNELVTNAVKYGATKLTVRLVQLAPQQYRLSISDDGPGLPADFDPKAMSGLGMKVIASLVRNLDGIFSFASDSHLGGSRFDVEFPL